MGDPVTMTALTVASSMASVGFSAASKGVAAQGQAEADVYKAQQLDEAAKYGELKATQTAGQMTRNLTMTLGNIDAVRAASRTDPTSPTGAAVRDYVENIGEEQRGITVNNIQQQARMDENNAAYMRTAASNALLGGDLSIAGTLLSALPGGIKSMSGAGGGGSPDGGMGLSLTGTGGLY
jgi:hypothetical protein